MSFESFFQSEGMNKIKAFGESEDIINRTGKAEANGRFLNKSEKLYRYAPMIKPIDSFEDFTCHADPYSFYIDMVGEGKEKDFIELLNLIGEVGIESVERSIEVIRKITPTSVTLDKIKFICQRNDEEDYYKQYFEKDSSIVNNSINLLNNYAELLSERKDGMS